MLTKTDDTIRENTNKNQAHPSDTQPIASLVQHVTLGLTRAFDSSPKKL